MTASCTGGQGGPAFAKAPARRCGFADVAVRMIFFGRGIYAGWSRRARDE